MTPLWGTKTPSAPVGDRSGGDRRAARSLLSCALLRGMGRLWRGMGGMGRPEPLSAHRPHQQHDHSGFHGSRETSQETRNAAFDSRSGRHGSARVASRKTAARSLLPCALWRGMGRLWCGMGGMGRPEPLSAAPSSPVTGPFGFSRNTKHETRITAFMLPNPPFPAISHHFPGKNLSLSQYPRPVHRSRSALRGAPFAAAPSFPLPRRRLSLNQQGDISIEA